MALSDLVTKIVIKAEDLTASGMASVRGGVDAVNNSIKRATTAALGFVGAFSLEQLSEKAIKLADSWSEISSRVKLAAGSDQEFATSQQRLFSIAQSTKTEYEAIAALYARVAKTLRDQGFAQADQLNLTKLTAEAFKISGASAAESSAGVTQLAQALGSGVLRGDEFNSIMEAGPRLAQALAAGLDVPVAKLREMAEAGDLTTQRVVTALLSQRETIAREFATVPTTVSGAITQAGNELLRYVGSVNEATGGTSSLAAAITGLSASIPQLVSTGKVLVELYAVSMARGVAASTAEIIRSTIAKREEAAQAAATVAAAQAEAAARLQVTQAVLASVRAQLAESAAKTEQLALDVALTKGTELQAVAELRLTEARAAHAAMLKQETAALFAVKAAQDAVSVSAPAAAEATSLLSKATGALNTTLNAFLAFEIGKTIGEWLNKFESVRVAGTYIAQAFVLAGEAVQYFGEAGKAVFTDDTAEQAAKRSAERVKKINEEFDGLRAAGEKNAHMYGELAKSADTAAQAASGYGDALAAAVAKQGSFERGNRARVEANDDTLKKLLSQEIDHLKKVNDLTKQGLEYRLQLQKGIAEINNAGTGNAENAFNQQQIALLQAEQAQRAGNYHEAIQQYQAIAEAAKRSAIEEAQAIQQGGGSYLDKIAYTGQYEQALKSIIQITQLQSQQEQRQATDAQQQYQDVKNSVAQLGTAVTDLNKGVTINIDGSQINQSIASVLQLQNELAKAAQAAAALSAQSINIGGQSTADGLAAAALAGGR